MIMASHGLKPDLPERPADGVRPDPRRDDGRRERAARPRRHPDHVIGRPRHGSRGRDRQAHVRHGRTEQAGARTARRRRRRSATTRECCATWPSSRSTRRSPTGSRTRSARSRSASSADIVLWEPAFFGAKPNLVLKAGFPAWGLTGDPNATVDRAEPLVFGPQFGGHGATAADLSLAFVSRACDVDALGLRRRRTARPRLPRHRPGRDGRAIDTIGADRGGRRGERVTFDGVELSRRTSRVGQPEPALLPLRRRQPVPVMVAAMSDDESPPRRRTSGQPCRSQRASAGTSTSRRPRSQAADDALTDAKT